LPDSRAITTKKGETYVRAKTITLTLAVLGALAVTIPTHGFAGRKGPGKGPSKSEGKSYNKASHVKLRAKLLPAPGLTEEISGAARYEKKSSSKGNEEKLLGGIKIPIPSSTLEISTADLDTLFNTTFLLKISQVHTTGTPPVSTLVEKGSCIMLLKRLEFEYEQGNVLDELDADYRLALKEKTKGTDAPELKKRVGDCDVVLPSTIPGGPVSSVDGIPDIADGDFVEVYVIEQTSPGGTPTTGALMLTGTFEAHDEDHDDDDEEEDDDD
jgi:hypothetical protein